MKSGMTEAQTSGDRGEKSGRHETGSGHTEHIKTKIGGGGPLLKISKLLQTGILGVLLSSSSPQTAQADTLIVPSGTNIVTMPEHLRDALTALGASVINLLPNNQSLSSNPNTTIALVNAPFSSNHTIAGGLGDADALVYNFGEREKFFVRFNNTSYPLISTDCDNWFPVHTTGTLVPIVRDESNIGSTNINSTLTQLQELEGTIQTLNTTLADLTAQKTLYQGELSTLTATEAQLSSTLSASIDSHTNNTNNLNTLTTTIQPEAQLRIDVHNTAANTSLPDNTKNLTTTAALRTYDSTVINALKIGNTSTIKGSKSTQSIQTYSTTQIPTLTDVQSTVTVLTNELSRLQTQITETNNQITTKQAEINMREQAILDFSADITEEQNTRNYWSGQYNYWNNEVSRLGTLENNAGSLMVFHESNYISSRNKLITAGRSDVPVITSATVASLTNLQNTILNEFNAILTVVNNGGTATAATIADETSSIRTSPDGYSSYYYVVDYPASGNRWPATLRTYIKMNSEGSYYQVFSNTVYNSTHSINTFNNNHKPKTEKRSQFNLTKYVLTPDYNSWVTARTDYTNYNIQKNTAINNRNNASNEIAASDVVIDIYTTLQDEAIAQKSELTAQKSQLQTLITTKSQLQSLYNRVQTILANLTTHVTNYNQVSAEITMLLLQIDTLRGQITNTSNAITQTQFSLQSTTNAITSATITKNDTNLALTQAQTPFIAKLQRLSVIVPQDQIVGTLGSPGNIGMTYDALKNYFSYGYRASKGDIFIPLSDGTNASVRAIVQYIDIGAPTDIYPAQLRYEYVIAGSKRSTGSFVVNNYEHKGVLAETLKYALKKLHDALQARNTQTDTNQGIKAMWDSVKTEFSTYITSTNTQALIRDYENTTNATKKQTILMGVSEEFVYHLLQNDTSFQSSFTNLLNTLSTNQGITIGTQEYESFQKILLHEFARELAQHIGNIGFSSLTSYTHYQVTAMSLLASFTNTLTASPGNIDINDTWSQDINGSYFRFGLHTPTGTNTYPATLWCTYSPDKQQINTLGPITINSANDLTQAKERMEREILNTKQSHTNYQGGSYDIFRGWGGNGSEVWWGKVSDRNAKELTVMFTNSQAKIGQSAQSLINSSENSVNFTNNEALFRSYFQLPWNTFHIDAQASLANLIEVSHERLRDEIGRITYSSININGWSNNQQKIAKVILSFDATSLGINEEELRLFQKEAILDLDQLGANYEQAIIDDTLINGRHGGMEELRSFVVLQKISLLFMQKGREMEAVKEKTYSISGQLLGSLPGGLRLYFAVEEGSGDSNIKKNVDFIKLCSADGTLTPGGSIKILGKTITLAEFGNMLLGYNAQKIGFTLDETIFGSFIAQAGIQSFRDINDLYKNWNNSNSNYSDLIFSLNDLSDTVIKHTYDNEIYDQKYYSLGYTSGDISPEGIFKIITQ